LSASKRLRRPIAGAVIVAAGNSRRMGGEDKLFASLAGEPVLSRVIGVFDGCGAIGQVVVVLREEAVATTRELAASRGWSKVSDSCVGGKRRQDSVSIGLDLLDEWQWVVVHDGARPLVTGDLIERGLKAATETGAAVAAVPVKDTIKTAGADRIVVNTPVRDDLWAVQTPQVFRREMLVGAYRRAAGAATVVATDDATLVERAGNSVKLYMGAYDNIKITTPYDLAVAEALWRQRREQEAGRHRL